MPFPAAALSAPNLVKLRGDATTNPTWYGGQYLSLAPNTTILTGQVNGTPTGASVAQFSYDNSTGSFASCKQDMTIILSHTNDRRAAYYVGRAWAVPTASIVYVNENSAPITDNDYFFIIDDYRIWDKLAREVNGVQYKDYSTSYRGLLPVVRGLQSAYAGWCNASNVLRLTLDASSSYAAHSGASISSYSWTVPAGTAYIVGSASTSAITIDVPHTAGDWIHLTVTDSGSRVRVFHLFVHPASDTYPPSLGFSGASISGNWDQGWNATIEGFSGLSSVLDNTFAVVWCQEYYNGTEGSIVSTVDFVGRFRQESIKTATDETYSSVQSVGFQLEGPAAQLSRVQMAKLALRYAASPIVWDEITNLTIWRAIVHILAEHTTFLNCHSLAFDSTANTFLAQQLAVNGGDSLRAVNDLAESINAAMEFTPQGEARVVRDLCYESSANRNAAVTYIDYTTQDYIGDQVIAVDPVVTVGKVLGSGAYYDSTADYVTPLLALAPGVAQDIGVDEPQLARQILAAGSSQTTAQGELNTRAGHKLEIERGANTLNVAHPDGYHLLMPSRYVWYTWTIAATDNVRGLSYTTATRWRLRAVNIDHDNERGTKSVSAEYVQETTGTAGQTVTYPAVTEITPELPSIPPFDPYLFFPEDPGLFYEDTPTETDLVPPDGQIVPRDGSAVLAWDSSLAQAFITQKFLLSGNPPWTEITPGVAALGTGPALGPTTLIATFDPGGQNYTLVQGTLDASNGNPDGCIDGGIGSSTQCEIQVTLPSIGTVTNIKIDWNRLHASGNLQVIYTIYDISNVVLATDTHTYSTPQNVWTTEDFGTLSVASAHHIKFQVGASSGVETDLHGRMDNCNVTYTPTGSTTLSTIWHGAFDPYPDADGKVGAYLLCDDLTNSFVYYTGNVFANPPAWTAGNTVSGIYKVLRTTSTKGGILIYSPSNGGSSKVAYSSDYGATFATALTVGTTPGTTGGFDAAGVGGTVSVAAAANQVTKATTLGGAYSNVGGALATSIPYLIIPWYTWGSDTAKNTGSSPQYLIGLSALVGGVSLYRDNGAGTRTDISPTGTPLAASANFATGWKGKRWAVVMTVAGTPHVYTTTSITTAGGGWTDRGAVAGCTFIIIRRRSTAAGQIFMNASSGVIKYMPRGFTSSTMVSKATPLATVSGLDVWG